MADVQWIKLSTELFSNRKIMMIREERGGDKYVLFWVFLLTLAGRLNSDGVLAVTESIPYSPKILAKESGFSRETVEKAIEIFKEYGMLCESEGRYIIKNWIKYQSADKLSDIREKTRQRVNKYRERRKEAAEGVVFTPCVSGDFKYDGGNIGAREARGGDLTRSGIICDGGNIGAREPCGESNLLSEDEISELKRRLGERRFEHYFDAVKSCAERGKIYTKTRAFDAILKMAEDDAREALESRGVKHKGARRFTEKEANEAFELALERTYRDM